LALRLGYEVDLILGHYPAIARGHYELSAAHDRGEEARALAAELLALAQGAVDELALSLHLGADELDGAVEELHDVEGARHLQDPEYRARRLLVWVDDEVEVELLEDRLLLGVEVGVAHPGHALGQRCLHARYHAGQQVHLVAVGDGDHHLRAAHARLPEYQRCGAVAHDELRVEILLEFVDDALVLLDDDDFLLQLYELLGDVSPDLATTYYKDAHAILPISSRIPASISRAQ
jgi:hypothetical protein